MTDQLSNGDEQSWNGVHLLCLEDALDALDAMGDQKAATAWLAANEIPACDARMVRVVADHAFYVAPHHPTGTVFSLVDGEPNALAVPVLDGGEIVDVLLVALDDTNWHALFFSQAIWLGRDNLAGTVVRLHGRPMEWLRAGRTGACHVGESWPPAEYYLLEDADTVHCADLATALWAWRWGFGGDAAALDRFDVDDTPENIRAHFQRQAVQSAQASVRAA